METIKLIHDITQLQYTVDFQDDFEGMLTITYKNYDTYIRHEHLGYPGGDIERLEHDLIRSLTRFYDEVKDGNDPVKDGLAD